MCGPRVSGALCKNAVFRVSCVTAWSHPLAFLHSAIIWDDLTGDGLSQFSLWNVSIWATRKWDGLRVSTIGVCWCHFYENSVILSSPIAQKPLFLKCRIVSGMLAFVHAVGRRHAGFMLAFLACARSGELEDESYFRATLELRPRSMHSGLHVSLFCVELM